jgi:hypothetical protein
VREYDEAAMVATYDTLFRSAAGRRPMRH